MLKKTHVLQVDFYNKKKDGTPLTYVSKKDGSTKKYKKVRITIEGGKQAWGACFSEPQERTMKGWSPDVEVELDFKETTKDGKTYLNFDLPRQSSAFEARLNALEERVAKLEENNLDTVFTQDEAKEDEINAEDIPF